MQFRALFLSSYLFCSFLLCETKSDKELEPGNVLAILGYLHGYKPGQNLQIPEFLMGPIIIVPKINDNSKSDTHKMYNVENLQENSTIFRTINPFNIIINDKSITEDNNDIEVNFRQALNKGNISKPNSEEIKTNESLKQNSVIVNKTVTKAPAKKNETTTPAATTTEEFKNSDYLTHITSTESAGIYPTAVYNNQAVTSLSITEAPPNNFLLPPLSEKAKKNFTLNTNHNVSKENNTKHSENITKPPLLNETDSAIKAPYPAALYNNAEIDQLSITTNSYTNGSPLPPPQDDRWKSFSSLEKMLSTSNEFRPLAGLYYDGFLHQPLHRNPGFVPYNHYYYY